MSLRFSQLSYNRKARYHEKMNRRYSRLRPMRICNEYRADLNGGALGTNLSRDGMASHEVTARKAPDGDIRKRHIIAKDWKAPDGDIRKRHIIAKDWKARSLVKGITSVAQEVGRAYKQKRISEETKENLECFLMTAYEKANSTYQQRNGVRQGIEIVYATLEHATLTTTVNPGFVAPEYDKKPLDQIDVDLKDLKAALQDSTFIVDDKTYLMEVYDKLKDNILFDDPESVAHGSKNIKLLQESIDLADTIYHIASDLQDNFNDHAMDYDPNGKLEKPLTLYYETLNNISENALIPNIESIEEHLDNNDEQEKVLYGLKSKFKIIREKLDLFDGVVSIRKAIAKAFHSQHMNEDLANRLYDRLGNMLDHDYVKENILTDDPLVENSEKAENVRKELRDIRQTLDLCYKIPVLGETIQHSPLDDPEKIRSQLYLECLQEDMNSEETSGSDVLSQKVEVLKEQLQISYNIGKIRKKYLADVPKVELGEEIKEKLDHYLQRAETHNFIGNSDIREALGRNVKEMWRVLKHTKSDDFAIAIDDLFFNLNEILPFSGDDINDGG